MERDGSGLNVAIFLIVILTMSLLSSVASADYIVKTSENENCSKPKEIIILSKTYLLRYCDRDISDENTVCLHNGSEFECYDSPKSTVRYE